MAYRAADDNRRQDVTEKGMHVMTRYPALASIHLAFKDVELATRVRDGCSSDSLRAAVQRRDDHGNVSLVLILSLEA